MKERTGIGRTAAVSGLLCEFYRCSSTNKNGYGIMEKYKNEGQGCPAFLFWGKVMTKEVKCKGIEVGTGALIYAGTWALSYYGVTGEEYEVVLFLLAYAVMAATTFWEQLKKIVTLRFLDENLLIILATAGAFCAGRSREAVGVMLFYQAGKLLQEISLSRTRKSVAEFLDIRPEYANLKADGTEKSVPPQELSAGQTIVLRPGERIPVDAVVTVGSSMVDMKALTGESIPRTVGSGDKVYSGSINLTGVLEAEVRKPYQDSTASRIMKLVEEANGEKTGSIAFTDRFMRFYIPAVILAAILTVLLPPQISGDAEAEWLYRGLIILVAACPCGLMVSVPLAFLGGIRAASRQGVLVKGGGYMETLSEADTFVFDKTGTLTEGGFRVRKILSAGMPDQELLELAAAAECYSEHPIGQSFRDAYGQQIDPSRVKNIEVNPGCGIRAEVDGRIVCLGNERMMEQEHIDFCRTNEPGTAVYVTVDGRYEGCIVISDVIRPGAKKLVKWLRKRDLGTVMMTGDNERTAENVARELGIDSVFAELMPEDKVEQVRSFMESETEGEKLVYVGEGINDAPVLALADVGIAMGGLGSDAALEAADIILMEDEPAKIISAIRISRAVMRSVKQNLVFAVGMKVIMVILAFLGFITMQNAIIADLAVMLINILNSFWITGYPE